MRNDQRANAGIIGNDHVRVAVAGFAAGLVFWSFYRIITSKFPLNFLNPTLMCFALSGFYFGFAPSRAEGTDVVKRTALLGAGLTAFVVGNYIHKDNSVHFLFLRIYYTFPEPTQIVRVMSGLIVGVLFSPIPFFCAARGISASNGRLDVVGLTGGAAAGLVAAAAAIGVVGAYPVLTAGCVLAALAALPVRWIAAATGVAIAISGVVLRNPPEAFFTWQLRSYEKLDEYWTPFYKIDFVSFIDDHCLGGVHNTVMLWGVCDSPDRQLMAYKRLAIALASGDRPVRSLFAAGRNEGSFSQSMKWNNPALERVLSVEFDRRITEDIRERFGRYNADVFHTPGFESRGEDIRSAMRNTRETFDAVYINGAGIMLFFQPMTFISQEDYLYTKESYRWIFDRMLNPGGVFFLDRGTNVIYEAYQWAGSLPKDVAIRFFWTKLMDYPFAGGPLGYVFASRDPERLQRIADILTEGNVFSEIEFSMEDVRRYGHSDDRPFMQPLPIFVMLASTTPVILLFAWLLFRWNRTLSRNSHASDRSRLRWFAATTAATAVVGMWAVTRGARPWSFGLSWGFVLNAALLLAVAGSAYAAAVSARLRGRGLFAAVAGLWLVGMAVSLWGPWSEAAAVGATIALGAGVGVALVDWSTAAPAVRRQGLIAGVVMGILVFQWLLAGIGFSGIAILAASVVLVGGLTSLFRGLI